MAAIIVIASAGCSKSSSSTPPVTTPTNISGQYSGTMQDAQSGSGTATASLAQRGADAGGTITDVGTSATLSAQVSLVISSSNAVDGTIVINYPSNGPTCTFTTTGTYDTSTNVLSGSYTAVTNCSGDTGTYSLTQQCTATVTSVDRRRMKTGGVTPC
jgi:hypothetical protein